MSETPYTPPGALEGVDPADYPVVKLLAAQWRENRRLRSSVALHPYLEDVFIRDSYKFAIKALRQVRAAGVEIVLTATLDDTLEGVPGPGVPPADVQMPEAEGEWDPENGEWITLPTNRNYPGAED